MKSLSTNLVRILSLVAVLLGFSAERPLFAQECPLVLPASPSNDLTAYITQYPYAPPTNAVAAQLISLFMVDVTNIVDKTNYVNPPIPYGLYPAWCVDQWDEINPTMKAVPGTTAFAGALYSTCDPNLNNELPSGHPNTLVSSTNWQMVNYVLNHQTYDGTNAFYWSVEAAIATLVGNGEGFVGFCGNVLNTPVPQGTLPDGRCGYPTYDPTVVAGLLTAASNNYASWVPACGDVYGAIYVTTPTSNQFLMLEVPVPCSPCIQVTKKVACLQPNGACGQFSSLAQGFSADCPGAGPANNPAFCYEITVTNCGTIPLTNIVVSDNLLGELTTNFFASPTNVFEPGASATVYFSMAFSTNATNTVTVQGQAQLAQAVTNGASIYTNGMPAADTATAVALVSPASISCGLTLYSALDLDGNTNDNDVLLPPASYFSQPPSIAFSIQICNNGSSALSGVTITAPALTALGFNLPPAFSLAVGQCTNIPLGSAILTCSNQTFFSVNTSGTVEPDAVHCGVNNLSGSPIYVCSSCMGTVGCTNGSGGCPGVASVSGTVVLDCQVGSTNLSGDTPMSGVPVVLYGAASNSLATNITDVKGDYSFTNLSAGAYYIAVEAPTNYAETYPIGVTGGEVSVSLVACQNLSGVNFGFADTTPPIISLMPGLVTKLGCNPTNLPSDSNFVADVIAIVSCGSSNIMVTHSDTNVNCLYTRDYLVTVTDTYGNSASTNFVYTWTSNTVPPVIVGAPTGGYLGCNPTNLPTLPDITNGITASNACNLATLTATNILSISGCSATNVFIITAQDACGNSASTNVVYTWMVNSNPPSISGTPLGGYLGCNPTNLPTSNSVLNGVSASNACGLASLTAPDMLTSNGCTYTDTFTITAVDGCGNMASVPVTYTWTASSAQPVIVGVPAGGYLGCNPTNLPTLAGITNGMSASNGCSVAALSATNILSVGGCSATNLFIITAQDACGNSASTNVVYTWTVNSNPPSINGAPLGGFLGCNPTNLPTSNSVLNGVSASNACGLASLTAPSVLTSNGCYYTNTFTITAVDGCGNMASVPVTYTWAVSSAQPVIVGAPAGGYLGCNPTNLPTLASITNGISASNGCSVATLSVTNMLTTNGCYATNVFIITAQDACGNSASTNVIYSWTANTVPPAIKGAPLGGYLGCNPTNLPSTNSILSGVSATNACGAATLCATSTVATNGCYVTNTFTIKAIDGCGNMASVPVTYTWTANSTPPAIKGAPLGGYLGCNPTNLPTTNSVLSGVSASNTCGIAALSATCSTSTNGCYRTNTFTIKAIDGCGNMSSTNVVYSWTTNTSMPVIHMTPGGASLGCNPTSLPTVASVTNGMSASASCGSASLSVTCGLVTNGCFVTNTFTIKATDGCGNTASTNVVYTWTANVTGPMVTCPSNVTVVTNICQMYCTFTPGDWAGSCNGGSRYGYNWWQNYCGSSSTSQCFPSFTNWWNSCGSSGNQCSSWLTNWNNSRPANWWGSWQNSGYQNGNWYNSWNNNNNNYGQGSHCFVPCSGNNPNNILNTCFNNVYPNGCVAIGNTNGGKCVGFTSCSAAQTCLNWGGNPGVLNSCSTNPSSCSAGSFCAQVLALQLNCDFGDYGSVPGYVGKCGDLVLCNSSSPCNGYKVRDILSACNCALGGGACPQGCSVQYLCGLCSNLNQCFEGCQVSSWCSTNLSSVYIPIPAQTGTATVEDTCSPNPTLTYHDTVTQGSCSATYIISRQWMAVDSCGNSNTCTQTITVAQTNSASLSGVVVLACSGDANLSNNEGIANVTVNLENGQGQVIDTTTTDANGNYSFSSLAPAAYMVVVTPPGGYTETYPAASGNKTNVTISACEELANVNFAYIGSTVGVQLIKTAPACMPCSGAITYTFTVTNTGNTCETLSVVDPLLGGTIFSQTGVAPGQGFVFTSNYTIGASACMLTNTAWAIGTGPNGKSATNTSSVVTCVTTKCVTNEICGNFNSQNPGNGYVWCNAHLNCTPNKPCTVYCRNATVTFNCNDGKTYTYPVPDCQVQFTNCSSGNSSYNSDNNSWATTLPCAGDSQCFLSGCGIPWKSEFANCQSVCWTGVFSCSTTGVNCNWQWGAACYNNGNFASCGSVSVKPCQQTQCGYNNNDCAGTPENCKSSCQGGGCGYGGNNYCGSWSSTGSFSCR